MGRTKVTRNEAWHSAISDGGSFFDLIAVDCTGVTVLRVHQPAFTFPDQMESFVGPNLWQSVDGSLPRC